MAGHSKWANIKHRKGAQDAKRSKVFTRMLKEIQVASKEAGPDVDMNPRLRLAVQSAKKANVPKDNIEKAINKGSGSGAEALEEISYEGYGPHGVAIFVECLTDNLNRTVSNVRSIFSKFGGSLGTNGSVSYMFDRKGVFTLKADGKDPDELLLELIDFGAEEAEQEEDLIILTCQLPDYGKLSGKLEELGIETESQEPSRIPSNTVELDVAAAQSVLRVIERLEDDDDVQNVFHNLEMTEDLMAALT